MGDLLTWRCQGLATVAPAVKPKAGWGGPDGLPRARARAPVGRFLAAEVASLLPLSSAFPQGSVWVRRTPWPGPSRR